MHPHRSAVGIRTMLALVPLVWAISIAMASPMAIWKRLEYWTDMPMGHLFDNDVGRLVVTATLKHFLGKLQVASLCISSGYALHPSLGKIGCILSRKFMQVGVHLRNIDDVT